MIDIVGFLIWILATLLKVVIFLPAIVLSIIQAAKNKKLGDYFYSLGIGTDIYGNKLIAPFANRYFKKEGGHDYGCNETISLCMAKNRRDGFETKSAKFVGNLIEFFDPNHLQETLNKNNMDTIEQIRAAYNLMLDTLAASMGETTMLNGSQKATIAEQADEITETVNPNLPPRPNA